MRSLRHSLLFLLASGTAFAGDPKAKVGERVERLGDEIVACGQLFHTTAPVKLWTDPGGYDAYRIDHRFGPAGEPPRGQDAELPKPLRRYGSRRVELTPEQKEQVRGGGWDLPLLQDKVDQFVIHFDVCGSSKEVLRGAPRPARAERPVHARRRRHDLPDARPQGRSLARDQGQRPVDRHRDRQRRHLQAGRPDPGDSPAKWYARKTADGKTRTSPCPTPNSSPPSSPRRGPPPGSATSVVTGVIQGESVLPSTTSRPQQYDSLTRLTATLCKIFPKIRCDYPKDARGAG